MAKPDRWFEAIRLLAAGTPREEIAAQLGTSPRSLRRWAKDPAFQAALADARSKVLDRVVEEVQGASLRAVQVLRGALEDESPTIRVRAADRLLSHATKLTELVDLEQRVRELEGREPRREGAA